MAAGLVSACCLLLAAGGLVLAAGCWPRTAACELLADKTIRKLPGPKHDKHFFLQTMQF